MNKSQTKNKMIETAGHRINIYSFLSLVFRSEVTKTFLNNIKEQSFLSMLSDMGVNFDDDFLSKPEDALVEDLAVEYARLFLGPDKHISPHESVHHERNDGDWGTLWGRSTVEVKTFIETSGLKYNEKYSGLPDHISVELEFMQEAARNESQAWKEKKNEEAVYCLKMEKKFIEEHLLTWVPVFCDKIIADAEMPFYREMAELTKSFIEFEKKEIDNYISEVKKETTTC
jgi:TorA maturation chaperone TorD